MRNVRPGMQPIRGKDCARKFYVLGPKYNAPSCATGVHPVITNNKCGENIVIVWHLYLVIYRLWLSVPLALTLSAMLSIMSQLRLYVLWLPPHMMVVAVRLKSGSQEVEAPEDMHSRAQVPRAMFQGDVMMGDAPREHRFGKRFVCLSCAQPRRRNLGAPVPSEVFAFAVLDIGKAVCGEGRLVSLT